MEVSEGRKVVVIEEESQSINPGLIQRAMENRETGDMMQPIVCEEPETSLSTTAESFNIDQSNPKESQKQAGIRQQSLLQQTGKESKTSESNGEIELKYPQFGHIISKMEAYKENEKHHSSYTQKRMDCMAPKKPDTDKKFMYSSRMEVNKESNYPFNTDYDWSLATVLGAYPDDLESLDFLKNLEGNIRNLLETPKACPLDIGTLSKNICATLLSNENVVASSQTGGELLDEQGDERGFEKNYDEEGFQEELYEVQIDERGKEKDVTPVKSNYGERNNFNRFRNKFYGTGNMNRFKRRNKPLDH